MSNDFNTFSEYLNFNSAKLWLNQVGCIPRMTFCKVRKCYDVCVFENTASLLHAYQEKVIQWCEELLQKNINEGQRETAPG